MKVFLSRDNPSETFARRVKELGWELTCFSCITKELTTKQPPPKADWIFFYSPSAVGLFSKNFKPITPKSAALGKGTARAMRELGLEPAFEGTRSDPLESIIDFGNRIQPCEKVVQARGENSFERLREALGEKQIIDWPFYRSLPKANLNAVAADYYIFTSPSNAIAYLSAHTPPEKAACVVFGKSTKAAIRQKSNLKILVTEYPGEDYAIKTILADL